VATSFDGFPDVDEYSDELTTGVKSAQFGADTYEQLKLRQESRKLAVSRRKMYDSQRPCLELRLKILQEERKVAEEMRLKAEAEREQVKEQRRLVREVRKAARDRRREKELELKLQETKLQAFETVQRTHQGFDEFQDLLQDEENKRAAAQIREGLDELIDPEVGEFRVCPSCREYMGQGEHGGMVCSSCGHRIGE